MFNYYKTYLQCVKSGFATAEESENKYKTRLISCVRFGGDCRLAKCKNIHLNNI